MPDLSNRIAGMQPFVSGAALPVAVGCALLAVVFLGCGRSRPVDETDHVPVVAEGADGPQILAVAGAIPVTVDDFRFWWEQSDHPVQTPETRRKSLDELIERILLSERARRSGLGDDPFVRNATRAALIARLKETVLEPRLQGIDVPVEEQRRFYQESLEHFRIPPRVRVAVLWSNTRGIAEREQEARKLYEHVRSSTATAGGGPASVQPEMAEAFGALAANMSEHQASRFKGGRIGWLQIGAERDPWRKAVVAIAEGLKNPGDVSDVICGKAGTFVVRLIERQDGRVQTFDEVQAVLGRQLTKRKRAEAECAFLKEATDGADVTVYEDRVNQLAGLPVRASTHGSSGLAGGSPPAPKRTGRNLSKPVDQLTDKYGRQP